jgi:diguanylate cyclase (GGDEF)-like protein
MNDSTTQAERLRLQALYSYHVVDSPREESFDRVVRLARSVMRTPIAVISLVDRDRLWFKARSGITFNEAPREPSLCAHAVGSDGPFIIPDTHADARFRLLPLVVGPPHVRSYFGVPLCTSAGYRIGTLCAMDIEARQPELEQIGILNDLAALVMDELELRLLATTDGLTGALSRRAFLAAAARDLAHVRRHGGELSCILLDLDYFKRINDTHGHAVGDRALQDVVMLLKNSLRNVDYVGRLGGEEFAVIMPGADGAVAHEIGERLRRRVMNARLPTQVGAVRLTVSIGVATLTNEDARIEDLLRRSDQALYLAKTNGRNRLVCADLVGHVVPLQPTAVS